jgi:histidyl-tRNA synthetase
MDYYNLTVFEWVTDRLGAQGTVCGGGRYDGLIEQLGGKSAPAVGWGLGIERLLLLIDELGKSPAPGVPDVFAIALAGTPLALVARTLELLRAQGVQVLFNPAGANGPASAKSQFKKADTSGAHYALVFGPDEVAEGKVAVKALLGGGGQVLESLADIATWGPRLRIHPQ